MAPEKMAQEKMAQNFDMLGKNGTGKNGTFFILGKNGTRSHTITTTIFGNNYAFTLHRSKINYKTDIDI